MQRSWYKNANPKSAGFVDCLSSGFGFGKMTEFSWALYFSNLGFNL